MPALPGLRQGAFLFAAGERGSPRLLLNLSREKSDLVGDSIWFGRGSCSGSCCWSG